MKRRRPVSYAEDEEDYSDQSDSEYSYRPRDIDNNKVRNEDNRESRSGIKKAKLTTVSEEDSDAGADNSLLLLSKLKTDSDTEFSNSLSVSSPTAGNKENEEGRHSEEREEGHKNESWWELDPESGKYQEKGTNLRGFELKMKMKVRIRDDHLILRHVQAGNGKIKCDVKVENVRAELGIQHGTVDQPIKMETHTVETHPLICPFSCPDTNTSCEASFQRIDQKYFVDHVINGKCPYSKGKKIEDFLPERTMICDICSEEVSEKEAQQHMDKIHFKVICPICKGRYEDRVAVEDHIINDHATHFMSGLASVYRKTNRRMTDLPDLQKEIVNEEPERSEYQTLEDLLREKAERDAMIKEQAKYLAGLKGLDQKNSANNFLLNLSPTARPPQFVPMRAPLSQRQIQPQSIIRMVGSTKIPVSPSLRSQAPTVRPQTLPSLQQVRLQSGQLMWAAATELPALVPGGTAKVTFKIVGPVVAGAPPPLIVKKAPAGTAAAPVRRPPQPQPVIRRATPLAARGRPRLGTYRVKVSQPSSVLRIRPRLGHPQSVFKMPVQPLISNGTANNGPSRAISGNSNHIDHSYQQPNDRGMEDEIEEVDPLALDEGVDPLAGL